MLPRGLLKEHSQSLTFMIRMVDVLAIVVAGFFAFYNRFGNVSFPLRYSLALAIGAGSAFVLLAFFGIYESIRAQGFWQHLRRLIQAVLTLFIFLAGLAFLTKTGETFSRGWFLLWGGFALVLLVLFRTSLMMLLRFMRQKGWNERRVVIIGAGSLGVQLAEAMQHAVWTGYKIPVIFDDTLQDKQTTIHGIPVQQTPDNLAEYLQQSPHTIDEIWLALPLRAEERVKEILYQLRHHTLAIRLVLDVFGFGLFKHSVTDMDGFPMLNLNASPMVGMNRMIKAIEDRVLASLILILISPVLLLIALSVKLSSPGPIFFRQVRHGWDGRLIEIYKFRTMQLHEEHVGKITQATANDARVTRLGRFLRKTSLDELPQFINVMQGRMSIVGPRPHAIAHNEFYKESIDAYMQRHKVKPGITGWAQVNGWRGETETLDKMQKRVDYDLYYIENWSLWFDLKIIFLTFFHGFMNKNAY